MYDKVSTNFEFVNREKKVLDFWNENHIFEKSIDSRKNAETFTFYDGPPTANGKPHIGHVLTRVIKDMIPRYKTMKGYMVPRKAGWDTHGLPVEIEVEKLLGIEGKQGIEEYGLEPFIKKCKESVWKYKGMWEDFSGKVGFWADMKHPYVTYDNTFIESEWWALKQIWDKGLLYKGFKIVPYCPRCGTPLSSQEVAQGYKDVKERSAVVKFKAKGEDAYFLAWTTTPWTLPSNVALCVNPAEDYVKIKVEDGTVYYMAQALVEKFFPEGVETLATFKGKELEYREYEPLFECTKSNDGKKGWYVTCDGYVTLTDGTGIVHIAPAFGEDDANVGKNYDLPFVQLVDAAGCMDKSTPWAGKFCKDADKDVLVDLDKRGLLFSAPVFEHSYPHCWRCDTPLIYYARDSWFIKMTAVRDDLVRNNNTVNWIPESIGKGRFGDWIENVQDWSISRNRYWGTPLNVWECECGHRHSIGSIEELKSMSSNCPDDIELHRPYIDAVTIKCPKCGGEMHRVPEVIDCWFDSGSMPFAQHHYPFENHDLFKQQFPAQFISEAVDQTRGWFYSLMAISTFIKGRSPYKNVLVNDLILDKHGKKMSKHVGNTVDPFALFDKYGADAPRWYLLYASPAWSPTKFDEDGLIEIVSKFFGTLRNVYNFFALYSNQDDLDPASLDVPYAKRPELDRWIISKYNKLIKEVTADMDQYDHMKAVRKIQDFVIEDMSNWYIRRARRRFWAEELDEDKKSVYATTYEVMVGLSQLIAPFAPFISEEIYQNLTGKESVHLSFFPKADEALIDEKAEERMDLVRTLVGLGRGTREKERIKVRQPLKEILVDGKYESIIGDLTPLIKEELNIKDVLFESKLDAYMNYSLKPNFKVAGPVLGKNIKAFGAALAQADPAATVAALEADGKIALDLNGESMEISRDMVDVKISAKEGFAVAMENNVFTILDTTVTPELAEEGLARELVSKVQQMRKQNDYEMMDKIHIYLSADDDVAKAVEDYREYIMKETLAESIENKEGLEEVDLNGHKTGLAVERI